MKYSLYTNDKNSYNYVQQALILQNSDVIYKKLQYIQVKGIYKIYEAQWEIW